MEYREFGKTDLSVSALGFGAGHIGNPDQDEKSVERLLNEALDLGINLIDTARGYGKSEERIGKFLSSRRDEIILSSKCGYDVPGTENWTKEAVAQGVDLSLKTLNTEYIDIMHLHSCDHQIMDPRGLIDALEAAKEAGKVRAIAYSGENEDLEYALETGRFDSIQCSVNITDQRGLKKLIPMAMEKELGVIAKRPVANAFWRFDEQPRGHYCEEYWLRARRMDLSPPDGLDWTEYALRFAAFQPGVSSIIMGTSNRDHLKKAVQVLREGPLPMEATQETLRKFREHDVDWKGQV